MKISDIGERKLVQKIKALCDNGKGGDFIEGIGDDCAAYLPSEGFLQVVTIDALVEKSHFDFSYFPPYFLGRKAISVNLSDIAAMGAIPRYALVSLQLPKAFSLTDINSLYCGMMEVASAHNLSIVGGNLTSSPLFSIHIVMIGEVAKKNIISRRNGKVGDTIYVTGKVGSASAGFEIVSSDKCDEEYESLREAYLNPIPKVSVGKVLADHNVPSSMIDVSDGIASDLRQICVASGTGALIEENLLPASVALSKYALAAERDIVDYQLYGGEDYQLLFIVGEEREATLRKLIDGGDVEATKIGTIVKGSGVSLLGKDGQERVLPDSGFSHF